MQYIFPFIFLYSPSFTSFWQLITEHSFVKLFHPLKKPQNNNMKGLIKSLLKTQKAKLKKKGFR